MRWRTLARFSEAFGAVFADAEAGSCGVLMMIISNLVLKRAVSDISEA